MHAVFPADVQIVLGDGIFIHLGVHGRNDILRTPAGQKCGSQHIICKTVRHLRDHIGRSRSDHKDICLLGQRDMLHLKLKIPVKCIYQAFFPAQSLKGGRGDKIRCILCHDHPHIGMLFYQHTGQIGNFISSNSAGHTQYYGFSF